MKIRFLGAWAASAPMPTKAGLLEWFDAVAPSRPRLVITHGEDGARRELDRLVQARHRIRAEIPALRDVVTV